MKLNYILRCCLCGHVLETNESQDNICPECGYTEFDIIYDNEAVTDDFVINDEPKNCIVYLVTRYGYTMVVMKDSHFKYSHIDKIYSGMRLYTYNGALSARDAMLKKHPDWNIKVKQFK